MTDFSTLELIKDPRGFATLWLSREDKNNAFNAQMIRELIVAIDQLAIQATTKPADKALMASEADADIAAALADPTASYWLKHSLQQALPRDPVDAVNDAEWLFELLNKRCVEQLQHEAPPSMEMEFRSANGTTTQIDITQVAPVIELGGFKA